MANDWGMKAIALSPNDLWKQAHLPPRSFPVDKHPSEDSYMSHIAKDQRISSMAIFRNFSSETAYSIWEFACLLQSLQVFPNHRTGLLEAAAQMDRGLTGAV